MRGRTQLIPFQKADLRRGFPRNLLMLLVVLDINRTRVAAERRRSRFHSVLFANILNTRTVPGKGFMATPINAPMAGEIWHLSIEDLFQPVQEAPRLGGDGPFVINLSVSTAPINVPTKAFTSSPLSAHVYQIQVTEDGRTRYRLRLGPFASEDEADAILGEVRDTYPGALTATASASDLRVIGTLQAKADQRSAAPRPSDLVIDKALSQMIAAEKAAPEVAAAQTGPQKAPPQKAAPQKAVLPESDVTSKAEVPDISIDIAWPTPELGVPPSMPPLRAAPPTTPPAAIKSEAPAVAAPAAPKPQWVLPELDVPLPAIQKQPAAPVVAVAKQAAPPAPQPFELKLAPPFAMASAPVLTEVVRPAKSPASKTAAPKPAVIAAPVLIEAVAPKVKAPPPPAAPAPPKVKAAPAAAAPVVVATAAPAPVVVATAAAPVAPPLKQEVAPPSKQEMTPPPKKAIAPPPKQNMMPPPKPAAPKSAAPLEAPKAAPVLTQSVAPARRGWPKFRISPAKPMPNKLTSLQHVVVATAPVPAPREVKKLDEPLESLESTQTIRALTPKELEDNEASRWFVIQLALADHAFDPEAVPNLDIFREYRLYSVAGLDQGRVVHALRLGFFREEIGAVAVASYLAAFWEKPTIKRVSLAERERFAEQRVEARKDVGATGKHAIIEITDELVARRRRSTNAAAVKGASHPIEH
jgi:SPOR domain